MTSLCPTMRRFDYFLNIGYTFIVAPGEGGGGIRNLENLGYTFIVELGVMFKGGVQFEPLKISSNGVLFEIPNKLALSMLNAGSPNNESPGIRPCNSSVISYFHDPVTDFTQSLESAPRS